MDILYKIFLDPFVQMGTAPDLFVQTLWEGVVGGMLYALIALGFVLIFKASGVFNFAQGWSGCTTPASLPFWRSGLPSR
jgi:branched-chain amino acid transport system permease protein